MLKLAGAYLAKWLAKGRQAKGKGRPLVRSRGSDAILGAIEIIIIITFANSNWAPPLLAGHTSVWSAQIKQKPLGRSIRLLSCANDAIALSSRLSCWSRETTGGGRRALLAQGAVGAGQETKLTAGETN